MRHSKKYIEKCSEAGKKSQRIQAKNRLKNALNYRPLNSIVVFEIWTHNPATGAKNHIEIKNEIDNGNNRYNVYLNGHKWHKQFSRTGFCTWLFGKINAVVFH